MTTKPNSEPAFPGEYIYKRWKKEKYTQELRVDEFDNGLVSTKNLLLLVSMARQAGYQEAKKELAENAVEVLHDTWAKGYAEGAEEEKRRCLEIAKTEYTIEGIAQRIAWAIQTGAEAIRAQGEK